jgi:hypothetical protein
MLDHSDSSAMGGKLIWKIPRRRHGDKQSATEQDNQCLI